MNRLLLGAISGAAVAIAGQAAIAHARRQTPLASIIPEPEIESVTRRFIMYVIVPLWHAAGVADCCATAARRSRRRPAPRNRCSIC